MTRLNTSSLSGTVLVVLLCLAGCTQPVEKGATCTDGVRNGTETDVDCGGDCFGCLDQAACAAHGDCVSGRCGEGVCVPATCEDGIANGAETDVDCGGPACAACAAGSSCAASRDCRAGVCTEGVCVSAPSCSDGLHNGAETDVDCGGSLCDPCGEGQACTVAGDCASGLCEAEACVAEPSCTDLEKNGAETDVDCGGPDCAPCGAGWSCRADDDCRSGLCEAEACVAAASCGDGIRSGDETDVDCGGSCAGCADEKRCSIDADCVNATCEAGLCTPATPCNNGRKDPGETDVDCGGPSCQPCPLGHGCETWFDCDGGFNILQCTEGICGGPGVCEDEEHNGRETDVDCGGGLCRSCGEGRSCATNADCMSGDCVDGSCTAPVDTCSNGRLDGYESDVDCGGPCEPCVGGWLCDYDQDCFCAVPGDCWSCWNGVCGGLDICEDDVQNGHESDVDCGGSACLPCRGGQTCTEDEDCGSLLCTEEVCAELAVDCGDGVQTGYETDVDCGGRGCHACPAEASCQLDEDCASGFCRRDPRDTVGTCWDWIPAVQQSEASLACSASGVVSVTTGLRMSKIAVASPSLVLGADTVGYWLKVAASETGAEARWRGILAVVDADLDPGLQVNDEVELTGDHEEHDCETVLRIAAPTGRLLRTGTSTVYTPTVSVAVFENGGGASAEDYEGSLVALKDVEITDDGGFTGTETDGQPHWWIKVGNGVYVANDFGLTNTLVQGDVLTRLVGVVSYRHGVYVIVPRQGSDIVLR